MLNLPRETVRIIKTTKDDIVKLQKIQLYEGTTAEGRPIQPFYAPETIRIKREERNPPQPTDRVTLKDTGKFYKGIRVTKVNRKTFTISSRDKKTDELEEKYGKEIFGMDNATRREYINENFFPELKKYIESTTKLKMK